MNWLTSKQAGFYYGGKQGVEFYNYAHNSRAQKYDFEVDQKNHNCDLLQKNGFVNLGQMFSHDVLDSIVDKVEYCIKNGIDLKSIDSHYATIQDPFLVSDEVFSISFDNRLIDFAKNYFRCVPGIGTFNLRRSFVNDLPPSTTQLFHRDKNSIKFFKFFIYLNDVESKEDGPLTLVKDSWNKVPYDYQKQYRWTEKEIKNYYGNDCLQYLTAKKGDVIAGLTTCYHRGTKPVAKERTMLTVNYLIHPELNNGQPGVYESPFKIKKEQFESLSNYKKPVADFLIKV